jgi:hypothetical protein
MFKEMSEFEQDPCLDMPDDGDGTFRSVPRDSLSRHLPITGLISRRHASAR